jgi:hypothetical protein
MEKEGQRLLSGSRFGFKASLFLMFELGDFSAISRVVVVLFEIVISHVRKFRILRKLTYDTGNRFTDSYFLW